MPHRFELNGKNTLVIMIFRILLHLYANMIFRDLRVLSDVAQYSEPRFEAGGSMQQGMYLPRPHVWEELYDPIYVILRAVHRREFQTSIERFNNYAKARFASDAERLKTVQSPWPPWRLPTPTVDGFPDPRGMLHSKFTHGLIFNVLYNCVHGNPYNDTIASLAVHMLELAVTYPHQENTSSGTVSLHVHCTGTDYPDYHCDQG